MTQGTIERSHRSMKNVVKLEQDCSPWELQRALARFVEDYNHRRYHESLQNVTPADVYHGRRPQILARREQIKQRTLRARRRENQRTPHHAAQRTFAGHIYSDATGQYPARLNAWEKIVIETEIGRPSFVAWYRNPQQATSNSLRIPYQNDAGKWSSLQIDFLIVSRRDDGTFAASVAVVAGAGCRVPGGFARDGRGRRPRPRGDARALRRGGRRD